MRHQRPYRKGDYFLLPYAGPRCDLLVQLQRPVNPRVSRSWYCHRPALADGIRYTVEPMGCHRCTPSRAKQIIASAKRKARR